MSRDSNFVLSLYELFANRPIKNCLDSSKAVHLVVFEDANGKTCIEELEHQTFGLHVENLNKKQIYLLALDHCFFKDYEDTRCDCIIFDDSCLCFVELKLNVGKYDQATEALKKARKQLGTTIQFFKTALQLKSKNFFNFNLEAYVVMQSTVYPRKRASRDAIFVKFLEDFGVELFEKNSKTF